MHIAALTSSDNFDTSVHPGSGEIALISAAGTQDGMELSPDARAPGQATLLPVHVSLSLSVGLGTTSRGSHAGLAPLARHLGEGERLLFREQRTDIPDMEIDGEMSNFTLTFLT